MTCVVGSGPLYAAADLDDEDHEACAAALSAAGRALVIPALVVAEATCLIGTRLGLKAEAAFLASLSAYEVEAPLPEDRARIAELVRQYSDFPLGGTDASVAALAERLKAPLVATLDPRHFQALQPRHCDAFEIVP
ncbi:MAG: type II toxin-antitoxin system VapC family toxin [Acidimicrobiales bacterium]